MEQIKDAIRALCSELFGQEVEVELMRPEEQYGDYATNVALQLAGKVDKSPHEIAETLAEALREKLVGNVSEVSVAGPGFLNLKLTDEALLDLLQTEPAQTLANKVVVAEYSDPNPFKVLHAGHVYTTVVGDAISRLLEVAGATVYRVNYGGDVGLHVGKTIWAILHEFGGEYPEKLEAIAPKQRSLWLSAKYIEGNTAYEQNETAKEEAVNLNKRIYQIHNEKDYQSGLAQIYWTCRQWSYEAFDVFYKRLGTTMEKYYPESEVMDLGLQAVREHMGQVFEESDGAVVFKGEKYGLHTRVFINSAGLPTYEAKEVGLIIKKKQDYTFDLSLVITANEQQEYMAVMLKAIEQFLPELARASRYVPHGMVKLAGGVKMSSRKGNIITATAVLDITAEANKKVHGKDDEQAVLAAIKYAFLKNRIGGDLIYDAEESVAIEGNSGPYLQYAYARAKSILAKAGSGKQEAGNNELEVWERSLVRKIGEYSEVVDKAVVELMPHHVCTYLYELAQTFNSFYEHNRVIGDPRETTRLALVQAYADTLKKGLSLLNITAPEHM